MSDMLIKQNVLNGWRAKHLYIVNSVCANKYNPNLYSVIHKVICYQFSPQSNIDLYVAGRKLVYKVE